ncbi:indole-3-glycerol phosphate synthase TrpC [Kitasatospora sp. MMS16-BH015]|uniref:indole-3-glycerol phosphate synthase TrpC n=1 Tax=Kitasatospora sp. MMS16-BH015 TaxID=2018025 RepID=UPI000CF1FC39|nr:indole-3-glycerol phosphate synthase TrpC [Kitasatospora sp. MMS16-BH015]
MHLDEIVARKRADWARIAGVPSLGRERPAPAVPGTFAAALRGAEVSVIAEVKPKSPSKGQLLPLERAVAQARSYAAAGAAAVSVLADTPFFGGSPELVGEIATDAEVTVPVLYKDFLVDTRQVELAHTTGADAVLLIVRAVDDALLRDLVQTAEGLGLDALVETFTAEEIDRALAAGASIVGINNRDLQTFAVDLENSARLRTRIPAGVLTVSESGIGGRADLTTVGGHGFDAALIGENLLGAEDTAAALGALLGVQIKEAAL